MKRIVSALLAVVLLLISVVTITEQAYALTVIPTAYIDGYDAGVAEDDDAIIKIRLDSPATETTKVWYRTQFGSAHNLRTSVSLGWDNKFIDYKEGAVIFEKGENVKEVVIPHYKISSYEEVGRFYTVQLYKAEGNVKIDKSKDLQVVWHKEDYRQLAAQNYIIKHDGSNHHMEDNGTYYYPNSSGISWREHAPYDAQYWSRIGVNSYSVQLKSKIHAYDSIVKVYYDVNNSSNGHTYEKNADGWNGDGYMERTLGPRVVTADDRLRVAVSVDKAMGSDDGDLKYYTFEGHPNDTKGPSVENIIFSGGNYSAGQEIVIGINFDEIVRITPGKEPEVKIPIVADDGSRKEAVYWHGSGTDVLVFRYTVPEGKTANPIRLRTDNVFYGEGNVKDIAGNGFNQVSLEYKIDNDGRLIPPGTTQPADWFTFDGKTPSITSITADKNNTALRSGGYVDITLHFDRKVRILGDAKLLLNNGAVATRNKSSVHATTHTFRYNVGSSSSQDTSALYVTELTGATVISEYDAEGFVFPSGNNIAFNNIIIDNTKPTINVEYMTIPSNYRQSHSIKVTATDSLSGVNSNRTYQYGLSSGSYNNTELLGENITITHKSPTKVYIKVSDAAGNIQYYETSELNFDKTPPTVNFSYFSGTPQSKGSIGVSITDNKAGMDGSAEYTWYDESNSVVKSGTITDISGTSVNHRDITYMPITDGKYKLNINAEDLAGNVQNVTSNLIYIDKLPPTISISPTDTEANKSSYDIVITGADPNGDNVDGTIKYIKYRWESGSDIGTWNQVNDTVTTFTYGNNQSGEALLRVVVADDSSSMDSELNKTERTYRFTFDNTKPTIITSSNSFNTTTNVISIDINAHDELNDISEVYYAFRDHNNMVLSGDDWSLLGTANGTVSKNDDNGKFYLHVKATDTEGNEEYHISNWFILDNEAAIGTINIVEHYTNSETVEVNMTHNDTLDVQYKLSEDGVNYTEYKDFVANFQYTFDDASEGVKTIYLILKDSLGNVSNPVSDTVILDRTQPTGEIIYSTLDATKEAVVATITNLSDDRSLEGNIEVNKINHTFDSNGTYDFIITDEAGNQSIITAEVTWIDKVKPTVSFFPETDLSYTKEKTVELEAIKHGQGVEKEYRIIDQNNNEIKSFTKFENGDTITLDYDSPVYIEVKAVDGLGNTVVKKSGIYNVDNLPPVPVITYSTTNRTANNVIATVTFDESGVTVTNNGGSKQYTFTENGEFRFEFIDEAGNVGNVLAIVENIDRSIPSARITLSNTENTSESVEVTVSVETLLNAKIGVATLDGIDIMPISTKMREVSGNEVLYEATYKIDKNGNFGVNVIDIDTLISEISSVLITNIDTEPPIFNYTLSNNERTQDNIDVRIYYSDAMSEPVTVISEPVAPVDGVYTFTENGEYIFTLSDGVGNENDYTVTINNIDREITPRIIYSTETFTNQNVIAEVYSDDEEIYVTNNYENTEYIFTENGEFTFEVYDKAGNTGEITASVDWINKVGFGFEVIPSTKEKTNEPITLAIEPIEHIASVVSAEGLMLNKNTTNQFTVEEIGKYNFAVTDLYGNIKEISYYVGNIDMTPPKLDYTLGINTVNGRIFVNEGEEITHISNSIRIDFSDEEKYDFVEYDSSLEYDGGAHAFVAKSNGTYYFVARDIAGNESSKTIILTGIDDGTPPEVTITYSTTERTNENVIARVSSNEEIVVINNYNNPNRLFTENGTFTFIVSDLAGNKREIEAEVNNIDKDPPVINIEYSTKAKTNENVIVSLTSDETFYVEKDVVTKVNAGQSYEYTFENNHTAFFVIKDDVGNKTVVFAKVKNIDKEAPNILFTTERPLIVDIGDIDFDFDMYVYGDSTDVARIEVDTSGIDFSKAGLYEVVYKIYDDVGNMSTRNKLVDIIDPNEPLITRINGQNPAYDYYFRGDKIDIELLNVHDIETIYYLPEKTNRTRVKQMGLKLDGRVIEVEESGWYSILVIDKDFNKKFYHIFISK